MTHTFRAIGSTVAALLLAATPSAAGGGAPDEPILPMPGDGQTGVPAAPMLCALVLDPEDDPLDVTFLGRADPGELEDEFTVMVMPDTQYYTESYPDILRCQTEWILGRGISPAGSCPTALPSHGLDVRFTTHVGDCVENGGNDNDAEWALFDSAVRIFDPPGDEERMPFGLVVGNHDQGPSPIGNGQAGDLGDGGSTTVGYNQTFPPSRFVGRSYYGGSFEPDNNDNHYELFHSAGMDFIIIHMENDRRATSPLRDAVLVWADGLLGTYSDRRAIVVSHHVVEPDGSFAVQGQAIYNALRGHANWFLMLGGHASFSARRTDPVGPTLTEGTLTSMFANYQLQFMGGNGWLRILTFSPGEDRITVRTYSPWLDQFKPDDPPPESFDAENFVIPYEMTGGDPFEPVGPAASGVASGETVCVDWPGRQPGKAYEWLVQVSDGTGVTRGPVWTFVSDGSCSGDTDCEDGNACTADECNDGACEYGPPEGDPCNGVDDDCNGIVDDGWPDGDEDGTADCVDEDDDDDGVPDLQDCRPADPLASTGALAEVAGLSWDPPTAGGLLRWTDQGNGAVYDVAGGDPLSLRDLGGAGAATCLVLDHASPWIVDPSPSLATGEMSYFIVRAGKAGCERGTFGFATSGAERPAPACP